MALMQWLAEHRTPWLTAILSFATFVGDANGYILIVLGIYVMWDKALAVRLAVIVLLAMTLNHVLKTIIANPRPFIHEGTWMRDWAVSPKTALELASEFSTPSGHAMASAAFYPYLFARIRNSLMAIVAVTAVLTIGASRPYLGVHYLEDVLLGWPIGLALALIAVAYGETIAAAWDKIPYGMRIAVAVLASAALWTFTVAMSGWRIDSQPLAFLGYTGFLTGIIAARPLEVRFVNFDPRSASWIAKLVRFAISVALVIIVVEELDAWLMDFAGANALLGYALHYSCYLLAGMTGMFVAPWLFTSLCLAAPAAAAVAAE